MNILHPTLGDLIDRAVILDLKRLATGGFTDEYIEVEQEISRRSASLDANALKEFRKDLRFIHRQIWNINEQFHYQDLQHANPPNRLGLDAWRLNQERIGVLAKIDTLSGEFTRPEKVY